jgi:hypothetical protein
LFGGNEELFNETIEELDGWNGYLGDDRYYEMECLNEFYSGADAIEMLQRAFFGRDDDTWTTDAAGNKTYGSFNPNRDYFYYNGYGNLVSTDYKDYSCYLDDYFLDSLFGNYQHLYLDDEVTSIIEAEE